MTIRLEKKIKEVEEKWDISLFREKISLIACSLFILTITMTLFLSFYHQLVKKDLPCNLCLLQRSSMIMTALSLFLNLRFGIRIAHYILAMAASFFGLLVSLFHISLHLDPDVMNLSLPFLGKPLYVWSFYLFFSSEIALMLLLCYPFAKRSSPVGIKWQWVIGSFLFMVIFLCLTTLLLPEMRNLF